MRDALDGAAVPHFADGEVTKGVHLLVGYMFQPDEVLAVMTQSAAGVLITTGLQAPTVPTAAPVEQAAPAEEAIALATRVQHAFQVSRCPVEPASHLLLSGA